MRFKNLNIFLGMLFLFPGLSLRAGNLNPTYQVKNGKPVSVMLTCYTTTLLANGQDHTRVRLAVRDSAGREITSAMDSIRLYVDGDATITNPEGKPVKVLSDAKGKNYYACKLKNGIENLIFVAGTKPDHIKVTAKSGKLWEGNSTIFTLPADFHMMKPKPGELQPTTVKIDKIIGADISWLPQLEARGIKFYENGKPIDAVKLLKEHGMNYIRLRIFVNPSNPKGYSPDKGFCDLQHTLAMAKRIKDAGMKLLLDFHYSDYWADPQQQNIPLAWKNLDFTALKDSVQTYTTNVLLALKHQGTLPIMVQIGNEINHGMLWPDGSIDHPDQLASLLKAAYQSVKEVNPKIVVMIHLALGGQNQEARFWLNNMIARGVKFDVIGLSYYPQWHGTPDDLKTNLDDLLKLYHKPLIVAEYSEYKKLVNDIIFGLPDNMGKGSFIWEPLNARSGLFEMKGKDLNVLPLMSVYDQLSKKYLKH
ncbi:MAG: glycosyl hydrolase 53 family protein [Bacteroidales bacterium]|nr:glycosyl hydrolase 53 family protein [Bacteroidales bacterium]